MKEKHEESVILINKQEKDRLQPTDNFGLLKDYMYFTLILPGMWLSGGGAGMATGPGLILTLALLPVNVLITTPIFTLTQIGTRKKMSLSDYHETMKGISELSCEQFEAFLIEAYKYKKHAKSIASCAMFTALKQADINMQTKFNKALTVEQNRIRQEKTMKLEDKLESNVKVVYTLTENDEKQALDTVTKGTLPGLKEEKTTEQKKLIHNYFLEPKNAGKKTQHILKYALELVQRNTILFALNDRGNIIN